MIFMIIMISMILISSNHRNHLITRIIVQTIKSHES